MLRAGMFEGPVGIRDLYVVGLRESNAELFSSLSLLLTNGRDLKMSHGVHLPISHMICYVCVSVCLCVCLSVCLSV
jgi:hypothetical protein